MADIVRQLNPFACPEWDVRVTSHPDFSFFHGLAWARVLSDTYGFVPVYLATGPAERFESLLPLMAVDSWLTGRRAIALPFTDDCEPLGADARTFAELFQFAVKLGKARGWKSIECRGGKHLMPEAPSSLSFFGHHLDLSPGPEPLFEKLEGSVRRGIRKAEKEGVRVELLQSQEAIRTFYELQCRTRKRHGLPPQPIAFFMNIHRHVLSQNMGMVAVARHQGAAIAAAVYFHLGRRAIYKFGASDMAWQHLRPNNLVMWEAIKFYSRNLAGKLHLGRTSTSNEGLRRFKLAWGATEEKIDYLKYDLRQDKFVTETDATAGWHTTAFRTMPVFMSRLAGKLLYKHWA